MASTGATSQKGSSVIPQKFQSGLVPPSSNHRPPMFLWGRRLHNDRNNQGCFVVAKRSHSQQSKQCFGQRNLTCFQQSGQNARLKVHLWPCGRSTLVAKSPVLQGKKARSGECAAFAAGGPPVEAGSLLEKLDAEVIPLQESESDAEEKRRETHRRIEEAESTGKLDLSGLRLMELPPEVFDLTGLSELSLAGNGITHLDPAIGRLSSLSKLGLAGNKLRSMPPEIGTLKYLKGLWVHGNLLESLPAEIGQLRYMGILALGGNRLVTLPEEIGRLTSLTSLSVPGNRLESLDALACGRPLPELRALGLFGNCLREVPDGVLGRLPGLTELWLQGNNLTSLPDSPSDWAALKALKQLSIADNRLTSLPDALASLPTLKDLWVYGNHIQSIPQTLVEMPKLAHLWLEGNPLEPDALGEALSRLQRTSGNWAHKMVVGIDSQQAGGLAEEVWGFSGVRESVQVSTIVGSRDGRREGYFKLEHGMKIAFGDGQQEKEAAGTPEGEKSAGKIAGKIESGGAAVHEVQTPSSQQLRNEVGGMHVEGKVGEERGDALIFSYMSTLSGSQAVEPRSDKAVEASAANAEPSDDEFIAGTAKAPLGNGSEDGSGKSKGLVSSSTAESTSTVEDAPSKKAPSLQAGNVGLNQGALGDRSPRKGLIVVAFGSAPGVPNWAGVLKRVKASLNPDANKRKRPSNVTALRPETTTFDVLYVVDARRSWYTQGAYFGEGSELTEIDEGETEERGCSISGAEEASEDSEGEGSAKVGNDDDLQLEGDFRIGTSDRTSERGLDSPLERIRSRVAGRSTLLDAEELGIERVSSWDQSAAAIRAGNQPGVGSDQKVGSTETSDALPAAEGGSDNRNARTAQEQKQHQPDDGKQNGSGGSENEQNGSEQNGSGHSESQQNGSNGNGTGHPPAEQQLSCYYRAELEAAVGGYERVLLLGDSMGASASLLFSSMATRVLSFCPQVDLSTASIRCAEDDAWFGAFRAEVLEEVASSSAIFTVHCGCWLHDLEQAALLPAGKVTVVEHPVEDHRLAKELDYQGKLLPIVRTAVEEELLLLTPVRGHPEAASSNV